jgi:hypothetical protein
VPAFVAQQQKELLEERDVKQDTRDAKLGHDAGQHCGVFDAPSVLADEPGDSHEYEQTEQSLKKHEELLEVY